jgi:uncharacterized protein with HEPN domain
MSKRDNNLLLLDMLESANRILRYTIDYDLNRFLSDDKTSDAVARNFEIIGEAANNVSDEFKFNNPQIEWILLRGFRNRIVHAYFGVDYSIVWEIIENDIKELIFQLEQLLSD